MQVSEWSKLVVCVLVIVATTILAYKGVFDAAIAATLLAATLGYIFGNAHGILSRGGS